MSESLKKLGQGDAAALFCHVAAGLNAGGMASGTCTDTYGAGEAGPSGDGCGPDVTIARVGPGIVRIVLRPQSSISKADGAWASAKLLALADGNPLGVLLEVTGVESVSREAIEFYSGATSVAAFALLGRSPVDKIIAHSLRGLTWPNCPSRYFVDEQEALAWLTGYC